MTNNDELAMKLKSAAEKASGGEWVRESGEGWEAICSDDDRVNGGFIICSFQGNDDESNRKFVQGASPANILALLAERDAYKKRIAELKRDVDAANARVDTKCAQLCNQDEQIEMLSLRIAELEARTVAHDVGVMNIGNPYCEDHLVAWTVTGRQLAAGIYYLDARRVGDIRLEVEEV